MANNTTTTWRWNGRTNGNWEGANWADAYGVDVDDYPTRAKCLLPGAMVIFEAGAARPCANGPSVDCCEKFTLLVEAGYVDCGATQVGWTLCQPDVTYCYADIDLRLGSDACKDVFLYAGTLADGRFQRGFFFDAATAEKIGGTPPGFQQIVWQTNNPVFTPGSGKYFYLGGKVELYLRAPMTLVDNGAIYGCWNGLHVFPQRPEYTFVKQGSGSVPTPTVHPPRLPAHRKRRFMPRIALAGAR